MDSSSTKVRFIRAKDTLKTELTKDEKKFREIQLLDENIILKKKIICTTCGKNIKEKVKNKDIHVHPLLEVLWCQKCEEFYSEGEFSIEEDGSDKYCRWCGQGGNLYCCSYCSMAFCDKCVKRNIALKEREKIQDEDDWKCFVCVTNPLWFLRAVCDVARQYVDSDPKRSTETLKYSEENSSTESKVGLENGTKNAIENAVSLETNKNNMKFVNSSVANSGERRGRRRKVDDKDTESVPHSGAKIREKFESIVQNTINKSNTLRKALAKRERTWKKNYFGTNVTKLNETVHQCWDDFSKSSFDINTSINLIENSISDQFNVFKNQLKSEEKNELSSVDEPNVENQNICMVNASILFKDGADESRKSISASLVVNMPTPTTSRDSLSSNEEYLRTL